MTIHDFNNILLAVQENKQVKIGYQLHHGLIKIIKALGGSAETIEFFQELAKAESPTFTGKENEE